MYLIVGCTNYECTEGPEMILGEYDSFQEALVSYKSYIEDIDALDFSYLDEQVDEWIKDPEWKKDIYYGGFYGGSITLLEQGVPNDDIWDSRQLLVCSRERDPYSKKMTLHSPDLGEDITEEETAIVRTVLGIAV